MTRLLILVCLLFPALVKSQTLPQQLQDQIESYLEDQETEDVNIDDIITAYSGYVKNPLNLNDVSYEDLLQLQLLDEIKIQSFLDYRSEFGPFMALEELQTIPFWSVEDGRFLASFSSVSDQEHYQLPLYQMAMQGDHQLFTKWKRVLQEQKGYLSDTPAYLGDQNAYTVRYRYNYENRMKYGILLEKDAGEEFFTGSNKNGFDYLSAHFYLKDYSRLIKDLAIGDYTISMGQGIIAHNDFGAGKSSWVNDIKLGGRTIKPYNSVAENFYNRGAAIRLGLMDNLDVTVFGSYTQKDANITIDTTDSEDPRVTFTSFQASGYHRTALENEKENEIVELRTGGIIKWHTDRSSIAINLQHQDFEQPRSLPDNIYSLYRFRGQTLTNASIDYSFRWKNFNFFGEVAKSMPGGFAQLHGLLLGLDRTTSMSLLYRKYAADYHAVLPNAFGELSSVNNEEGIYFGLDVRPVYAWRFRMYADVWNHKWVRYGVDAPSTGREYLARLDYIIKRKLNIYVQYFRESKYTNNSASLNKIDAPALQLRQKLRFHVDYNVSKNLELRSRIEYSRFEQDGLSHGYTLLQDVIYKPIGIPISFTGRIVMFDTDDYDSRIYAYENDILYEFYIPAYFYQGLRYYLNIRYDVAEFVTAELRYANTRYTNRNTVGSSNELIDGNIRSDIKAQLRFSF